MKSKILGLLAVALLTGPMAAVQAAPISVVDASGHLTGAKGVVVGSTIYDVTFQGGSCVSLFNGCINSAFDFTTGVEVFEAAVALLNTVFVDSAAGSFDTQPVWINGCSNFGFCFVMIPFLRDGQFSVQIGTAQNFADETLDSPGCCSSTGPNGPAGGSLTYADFQVVGQVPESGTLALLGLGLLGLGVVRRRTA